MNDTLIVTVSVVLDDVLRVMGQRTDCRARTSDSEVLTVGVIAACQFQNHHERAVCILRALWLSLWPALRFPLQSSVPCPRSSVERRGRVPSGQYACGGADGGNDLHPRQRAAARRSPRAGVALPQRARRGILRLLCGTERDGRPLGRIWLATASHHHPRRHPGFLPGTLWVAFCLPASMTGHRCMN